MLRVACSVNIRNTQNVMSYDFPEFKFNDYGAAS